MECDIYVRIDEKYFETSCVCQLETYYIFLLRNMVNYVWNTGTGINPEHYRRTISNIK